MIAVAPTTPSEAPSGPVPIPGDQAQTGLSGDEQPTFDHVLAREAQSEDRATTLPSPGTGTVSKGHDPREADPHKDADSVAALPADPALLFQIPFIPESQRIGGGSATPTLDGSPAAGGEVSVKTAAGATIPRDASPGQGLFSTLDTPRAFVPAIPAALPGPSLIGMAAQEDAKPAPAVGTITQGDPRARSGAATGMKDGDRTGALNPLDRLLSVAPAGLPTAALDHPPTESVDWSPSLDAALPRNSVTPTGKTALPPTPQAGSTSIEGSQRLVTTRSDLDLGHRGSLFRQTPLIMTKAGTENLSESFSAHASPIVQALPDSSFFAHASPIISASPIAPPSGSTSEASGLDRLPAFQSSGGDGNPVVRGLPSLAPGAPSVRAPENQHVADQNVAPTLPRSVNDESADKRRLTASSAVDKGQESVKPTANQPTWLLNPIAAPGQSFAPARSSRVATAQNLTPLTATSSTADRAHHVGPAGSASTGDAETMPSGAGLSLVHTDWSNLGAASGGPTHITRTGAEADLYQPIAQRVLIHGASLHVAGAASSFNVVLNPRSLGMVTVHVARGQEGLQVTITPQQSDTTALLNRHLPDLIGMLKQGGQDLAVQAQVVQTHAATPNHNGTPQAAAAGQSGLNTFTNSGGQSFTGQQGNSEQGAWAATANDLFGVPDRGGGHVGTAPVAVQTRVGGAARVDVQA
jgi:flagellar hook-length control protein FliK